jgi:acetyltransferase
VKKKPVIVLKGGRTEAGAIAAASHTASLAGEDQIFEAACRQTGILLATEAMEPFHVAHAILCQPLPKGRRVGIMGTGGQCVLLADACASLGLEIPFLDKETQLTLKKILPANAPLPKNTIDWAGGYRSPIEEARLIDRISQLDYIDCIMMNAPFPMTWHGLGSEEAVLDACMEAADMLNEISKKRGKPIITLGPTHEAIISKLRQVGIPCYDNPGDCARAMYGLIRYAEKRTDS